MKKIFINIYIISFLLIFSILVYSYEFFYDQYGISIEAKTGRCTAILLEANKILGNKGLNIYNGIFNIASDNKTVYIDNTSRSFCLELTPPKYGFYLFMGYEEIPLDIKEYNKNYGSIFLGCESKNYTMGCKVSLMGKEKNFNINLGMKIMYTDYFRIYYIYYDYYSDAVGGVINFETNSGFAFLSDISYRFSFFSLFPLVLGLEAEFGSKVAERRPEINYHISGNNEILRIINRRTTLLSDETPVTWSAGIYYALNLFVKIYIPFGGY
ncbi:MAG: hypothetical protein QW474_03915 [Candidatus Aenigmatarchaeota archaeon]